MKTGSEGTRDGGRERGRRKGGMKDENKRIDKRRQGEVEVRCDFKGINGNQGRGQIQMKPLVL